MGRYISQRFILESLVADFGAVEDWSAFEQKSIRDAARLEPSTGSRIDSNTVTGKTDQLYLQQKEGPSISVLADRYTTLIRLTDENIMRKF